MSEGAKKEAEEGLKHAKERETVHDMIASIRGRFAHLENRLLALETKFKNLDSWMGQNTTQPETIPLSEKPYVAVDKSPIIIPS